MEFSQRNPKSLLPTFHHKTHFKAAESIANNEPGTLNIEDGSVDPILQDLRVFSPGNFSMNQSKTHFFNSQKYHSQIPKIN